MYKSNSFGSLGASLGVAKVRELSRALHVADSRREAANVQKLIEAKASEMRRSLKNPESYALVINALKKEGKL